MYNHWNAIACHVLEPNDYILARYDGDGNIYRARVEAIDHQNATVGSTKNFAKNTIQAIAIATEVLIQFVCFLQVFYVDYGNTEHVTCDALFEWDTMCNVIPFQAIICKLANAHGFSAGSASQAITDFICNNYLNKPCKVLVL